VYRRSWVGSYTYLQRCAGLLTLQELQEVGDSVLDDDMEKNEREHMKKLAATDAPDVDRFLQTYNRGARKPCQYQTRCVDAGPIQIPGSGLLPETKPSIGLLKLLNYGGNFDAPAHLHRPSKPANRHAF
jgi:hypothetical protein